MSCILLSITIGSPLRLHCKTDYFFNPENVFASNATIDKISSVNDAILATNIESLTRTVKKIEEKMLTKWDVAVVVFQIIGVIGVVIGVIIGVITLFS